jgi:hypothetical protein
VSSVASAALHANAKLAYGHAMPARLRGARARLSTRGARAIARERESSDGAAFAAERRALERVEHVRVRVDPRQRSACKCCVERLIGPFGQSLRSKGSGEADSIRNANEKLARGHGTVTHTA